MLPEDSGTPRGGIFRHYAGATAEVKLFRLFGTEPAGVDSGRHMVRAILFDLGDTLLDFLNLDNDLLAKQGAAAGYEYLRKAGCRVPSQERYYRTNLASIRWALIRCKFNGRE